MAVVLRTGGATWQEIADALLSTAERCRADPHYLWIERPGEIVVAREPDLLLRNLSLGEHWAFTDEGDGSLVDGALVIDPSGAGLRPKNANQPAGDPS